MATQRASAQKSTDADKPAEEEKPAPDTSTEDQAADVQETGEQVVHTDTTVNKVAPLDGPEHGYVGQAHPDKNRDDYTVAGVTGGTAKTDDKPQDGEDIRKAWAPLRS